MSKALAVLLCVLAVGYSLTDREICQQSLNGIFEQNQLADPATLMGCFSDDSAHKVVDFVGRSLDKAARGSLTDLLTLLQDTIKFFDSLPASEMECARANPEFQALLPLYHIDPSDPTTTEKKLIAYVTLHYLAVHKWLIDCDDAWNSGKYYDTGFKAAGYFHQILGADLSRVLGSLERRAAKLLARGRINNPDLPAQEPQH